jgi:hypothetical protein
MCLPVAAFPQFGASLAQLLFRYDWLLLEYAEPVFENITSALLHFYFFRKSAQPSTTPSMKLTLVVKIATIHAIRSEAVDYCFV